MHDPVANELEDYLDGKASAAFHSHLTACQECQAEVESITAVSELHGGVAPGFRQRDATFRPSFLPASQPTLWSSKTPVTGDCWRPAPRSSGVWLLRHSCCWQVSAATSSCAKVRFPAPTRSRSSRSIMPPSNMQPCRSRCDAGDSGELRTIAGKPCLPSHFPDRQSVWRFFPWYWCFYAARSPELWFSAW